MASLLSKASGAPHFSFSIDGVVEFDRAFNRLDQELDDLRSIWPEVAKTFYQIEAEQFASEGAVGQSGKWAALSKSYAKYKAVKFPNQPILKATNSLFDSMTNPDAPGSIFKPERSELTIGSSVDYGIHHQRGKGVPERKVISMNQDQKRQIQKAIQIGLVQFVRRQGFNILGRAA